MPARRSKPRQAPEGWPREPDGASREQAASDRQARTQAVTVARVERMALPLARQPTPSSLFIEASSAGVNGY